MKRDFDLIRKILFDLESRDARIVESSNDIKIDGYAQRDIDYNLELMKEADMVSADIQYYGLKRIICGNIRLLNCGHDVLDAIRDDTKWAKIKGFFGYAAEKIVSASIIVAVELAKQKVGM